MPTMYKEIVALKGTPICAEIYIPRDPITERQEDDGLGCPSSPKGNAKYLGSMKPL